MGKIKKCKLSWKPSDSGPNVEYRLYWSNVTPVGYDSNFIELGNITEVDLPDILKAHESLGGSIYIGISAVDKWENESDIITLSEPYKFSAPAAPADLALIPLNYYKITAPMEKAENQNTDIQKQVTEKTDREIQSNDQRPTPKHITTEGKIVDAINRSLGKEIDS